LGKRKRTRALKMMRQGDARRLDALAFGRRDHEAHRLTAEGWRVVNDKRTGP